MQEHKQGEQYRVRKITPKGMRCGIGACPTIYEVVSECGFGACPGVHASESSKDKYYIVGRQLTQQEIKDLGLAEKVGQGEGVVEVPKGLLRELKD